MTRLESGRRKNSARSNERSGSLEGAASSRKASRLGIPSRQPRGPSESRGLHHAFNVTWRASIVAAESAKFISQSPNQPEAYAGG